MTCASCLLSAAAIRTCFAYSTAVLWGIRVFGIGFAVPHVCRVLLFTVVQFVCTHQSLEFDEVVRKGVANDEVSAAIDMQWLVQVRSA